MRLASSASNHAARQAQFGADGRADETRQSLRAAATRDDADRDLGLTQVGAFGADPHRARERRFRSRRPRPGRRSRRPSAAACSRADCVARDHERGSPSGASPFAILARSSRSACAMKNPSTPPVSMTTVNSSVRCASPSSNSASSVIDFMSIRFRGGRVKVSSATLPRGSSVQLPTRSVQQSGEHDHRLSAVDATCALGCARRVSSSSAMSRGAQHQQRVGFAADGERLDDLVELSRRWSGCRPARCRRRSTARRRFPSMWPSNDRSMTAE